MMRIFMRNAVFVAALLMEAASCRAAPANFSIDALYATPAIAGTAPEGATWSPSGRYLAFAWSDRGERCRDVWIYDRVTRTKRALGSYAATAVPQSARPLMTCGVTMLAWLGNDRVAFVAGGVLTTLDLHGHRAAGILSGRAVTIMRTSPDGHALALVADGALFVMDARDGTLRSVMDGTTDDAVTDLQWDPASAHLAFVVSDTRAMPQITIDFVSGGVARHATVRRAFPGQPNTRFRAGIVAVGGGSPAWLARGNAEDPIWNLAFSPDGGALALSASDLQIKHHEIDVYDASGGGGSGAERSGGVYYRYDDPAQIRPDWQVGWAGKSARDGLLLLTNRDGFNHLYRIAAAGAAPVPLTQGAWEIVSFTSDPSHDRIYFVADRDGFEQRQLYRIAASGGTIERVTQGAGTHEPTFSPDFAAMVDRFSDDRTPPDLYGYDLAQMRSQERITRSPSAAFDTVSWADVSYIRYKSHRDGASLIARLMLPPDYRKGRRYPVIVGSVYSDAVQNQWGGRVAHPTWGLDQYLVAHGYIVLDPGTRGSFGYGRAVNRAMLHRYGDTDIDDIQDAAQFLIDRGYADAKHIGIWGSSYGGLMTLMSLFRKPGFYAAGVAGAPASNVAHAYPEQEWIMGPPKGRDFPGRYERQSPVSFTSGLADPLMIIHGTRDEVVLYSDTMAVIERLSEEQKMFELVTLPGANHPWDNENLPQTTFAYKKLIQFFDLYLREDARP